MELNKKAIAQHGFAAIGGLGQTRKLVLYLQV